MHEVSSNPQAPLRSTVPHTTARPMPEPINKPPHVSASMDVKPSQHELVQPSIDESSTLAPIKEELPHPFPNPSSARSHVKRESDVTKKRWYTESKDVVSSRTRSSKRGHDEPKTSSFMMARLGSYEVGDEEHSALILQSPTTNATRLSDLKNHHEAMHDDAEGWSEAELAELN